MRPRFLEKTVVRRARSGWISLLLLTVVCRHGRADEQAPPPAADATVAAPQEAAPAPPPTTASPKPKVDLPWELRPYRVEVCITFAVDARLDFSVRNALLDGLQQQLADQLGPMWLLTVREAAGPEIIDSRTLAHLTDDESQARWLSNEADKVYPLVLERQGPGFVGTVREWDRASQEVGPVLSQAVPDIRLGVGLGAALVREAFRALVQIETVDKSMVVFKIRAGELTPPDVAATQLEAGDLVEPFYRQLDKKREVKRVQHIPWTVLRADVVERARVEATAISAYPVAVVPPKRRMESMAIEVRPWYPETILRVTPRSNPANPIAAARVDIVDRLPTREDPVLDRLELYTDRDGVVHIPAETAPQVRYAIVNSGQAVLARVPLAPGAQRELTLQVIDDDARLSVEAEVSLLEADLIELVARRQILALRAAAAGKAGKPDEVKALIEQLRALPDQKSFQQRLDLVRTAGVEKALAKKDLQGESRIKKLCNALSEVSAAHLDQEKFLQTLRDLEEVSVDNSAGTKRKT